MQIDPRAGQICRVDRVGNGLDLFDVSIVPEDAELFPIGNRVRQVQQADRRRGAKLLAGQQASAAQGGVGVVAAHAACDALLSAAPLTAKQIVALLWPPDRGDGPDMHDPLREAIEQLCPPRFGSRPEAKSLGERLRRMSGRVIGGRRIVSRSSHSHAREWSVEVVA